MSQVTPIPKTGKRIDDPRYRQLVRSMPCMICDGWGLIQTSHTEFHHSNCGRYSGAKTSCFLGIPLCDCHHKGQRFDRDRNKLAIHQDKRSWIELYGNDYDFAPYVQDYIKRSYGYSPKGLACWTLGESSDRERTIFGDKTMTDTSTPKRIWADMDFQEWTDIEPEGTPEIEYILGDMYAALQAENARLREALELLAWQPVETAPKDIHIRVWQAGVAKHWLGDFPYHGQAVIWNEEDGIFVNSDGERVKGITYWRYLPTTNRLGALAT